MRWESLFADLEATAEAQERLAFEAELVDQVRAERSAITLPDRLRAQLGDPLAVHLVDGERLEGLLADAGADWLLLRPTIGAGDARRLVPLAAVVALERLSAAALPAGGVVARRLGLPVVLRALSVDRCPVRLRLRSGLTIGGTIDRVGADHLDLAVHGDDEPPRAAAVSAVRAVPLPALVLVHGGG